MPRFGVKQTRKLNLTSYSGLALIGQCCQAAQVDAVIDPRQPVSLGLRTSDVVKSMVRLLSLGKSDFEAIEPLRDDRFFKEALGLSKVPGSVWIRQRLDARGAELRELTDELSLRLIKRTEAPITAQRVTSAATTFVMDQPAGRRTPRSGGLSEAKDSAPPNTTVTPRKKPSAALIKASMATPRLRPIWAMKAGTSAWSCERVRSTRPSRPSTFWSASSPALNVSPRRIAAFCCARTVALMALTCCSCKPRRRIVGPRLGVPSTSSPSGIPGSRTRPTGWPGQKRPAPSSRPVRANGWG